MTNDQNPKKSRGPLRHSGFGFHSDFWFRHSGFSHVLPTADTMHATGVTMTSARLHATRWIASVVLLLASTALADDWPQWRGPGRDGISKETGLAKQWPADGPKLLWQVKDIGQGYGAPAVVGEHL